MTIAPAEILDILRKYLHEIPLKEDESARLRQWTSASPENESVWQALHDPSLLKDDFRRLHEYQEAMPELLKQFWDRQHSATDELLTAPSTKGISPVPVKHVHFLRTTLFRYAAMVLLIAGAAALIYNAGRRMPQELSRQQPPNHQTDIQPGANRAILTLTDGSTIVLDSATSGDLASQGNTKIIKLDAGSIAYKAGLTAGETGYNTISTPRGGQYQITLPDGTKVWLNAASSVRFPTAFSVERTITVTGEAYLEVATDKTKPFVVEAGGGRMEVLGTDFNINSYSDEPLLYTTLLKGSLQVVKAGRKVVLKPGQQAQVSEKNINLITEPNISQVIAWKTGLFNFEDVPLEDIMRQLSRWYNIHVAYPQGVPDLQFGGEIRRDLALHDVLDFLGKTGLHYTIKDRILEILP